MNWSKIVLAGVVGGIVQTLYNWLMYGVVLGDTHAGYPEVFVQEESGPQWFFVVGIAVAVFAAILFAKTRSSWGEGLGGGAAFGFFLGLVIFFFNFYPSLTIDGFPYYLSWCWGGIDLIGFTLLGAVLGLLYKR